MIDTRTRTRSELDLTNQAAVNEFFATEKPEVVFRAAAKLINLGSSCIYPKLAPQRMKEEHLLTGPLEPTNEPYAIAKIATLVAEVEGYEGEIHWDTTKPNGTPRKLMDGSVMRKLGWEPKIGLREGLGATYEWFVESGRE